MTPGGGNFNSNGYKLNKFHAVWREKLFASSSTLPDIFPCASDDGENNCNIDNSNNNNNSNANQSSVRCCRSCKWLLEERGTIWFGTGMLCSHRCFPALENPRCKFMPTISVKLFHIFGFISSLSDSQMTKICVAWTEGTQQCKTCLNSLVHYSLFMPKFLKSNDLTSIY